MSDDVSAVSMTDGALVIAARAADLARLTRSMHAYRGGEAAGTLE